MILSTVLRRAVAAGLAAGVLLVLPAPASAGTVVHMIGGGAVNGPTGELVRLDVHEVPESMRGVRCPVEVLVLNQRNVNESTHVDNDLVLSSGSVVTITDVERERGVVEAPPGTEIVLGDELVVDVRIGNEDHSPGRGWWSAFYRLQLDCPPGDLGPGPVLPGSSLSPNVRPPAASAAGVAGTGLAVTGAAPLAALVLATGLSVAGVLILAGGRRRAAAG